MQQRLKDGAGREPLRACLNAGVQGTGHSWEHTYSQVVYFLGTHAFLIQILLCEYCGSRFIQLLNICYISVYGAGLSCDIHPGQGFLISLKSIPFGPGRMPRAAQ